MLDRDEILRHDYDDAFHEWAKFVAKLQIVQHDLTGMESLDDAEAKESDAYRHYVESRNRLATSMLDLPHTEQPIP
ncbi:MAG: hypothetical protein U5J83_14315 [Bryobacterales bacterium]|nr:hypothetical protein [Bryobacterales bacterium]